MHGNAPYTQSLFEQSYVTFLPERTRDRRDDFAGGFHGGSFLVELRATVVALADLREVVLDHLLGHTHAVVGHAKPLLAGLLVGAPVQRDAQFLLAAVRFADPAGADQLAVDRLAGLAILLDLQPQFTRLQGVLRRLADAGADLYSAGDSGGGSWVSSSASDWRRVRRARAVVSASSMNCGLGRPGGPKL